MRWRMWVRTFAYSSLAMGIFVGILGVWTYLRGF